MTTDKTHYRKAFDSPYLSSADIVEPTVLTVSHVKLEADRTKKTKDLFNTAYFVEKEIIILINNRISSFFLICYSSTLKKNK